MTPANTSNELRNLLTHDIKVGGMNLFNPAAGADRLFQSSKEASEVLVASLLGNVNLDLVDHKARVRTAGANDCKEKVEGEVAAVKAV